MCYPVILEIYSTSSSYYHYHHIIQSPCVWAPEILMKHMYRQVFFLLKPNNQTHTDSQLTEADWGAGAGGCVGAWGPGGFVCGLFAGVVGGWEVYPQRSPWHQPVPEEKNQPLFVDGCCHFGDVAGQICEWNTQLWGFMRRACWSVDMFSD